MALNYRQATIQNIYDWLGELKTEFETIGMTINAFDSNNGLHITHPGNGASWVFDLRDYSTSSTPYMSLGRYLCLGINGSSPYVGTSQPESYGEGQYSWLFYLSDINQSLPLHIFSSADTNTVILYFEYPDGRSLLFIQTDLNTTLGDDGVYTVSTYNRSYTSGSTSEADIFNYQFTQMYAVFEGGNDGTVSTQYNRDNAGYYNGTDNSTTPSAAYLFQSPLIPTDHALNCNILSGGLRLLEPLPIRAAKKDQTCALLGYLPNMYAANIKNTATGQAYTIDSKKYIFVRVNTAVPSQVHYRQYHGLAIEIN